MIGFEPNDNIISLNCEYHEAYASHICNWREFANCNNLAADTLDTTESDDDTLEYGSEHEHEHNQSEIQEYMSTTYIQI